MQRPLPVVVYDGECGFCSRWVRRWQSRVAGKVVFVPFQMRGVLERLGIAREDAARALQWIGSGGERAEGSEAVLRALGEDPGLRWLVALGRLPPLSLAASAVYRLVARNRGLAARVDWLLFGDSQEPPSYRRVHALYLRALGAVYLVAFTSLRSQLLGLYGSRGIRPIQRFLEGAKGALGKDAFTAFPTVFWLGASDRALRRVCFAGQLASVALMAGRAPKLCSAILWSGYQSFVAPGREFLSYQWDALLLESGFNSILLAPVRGIRDGKVPEVPGYGVLLMRLLNFRLQFGSGLSKLQSGDPAWRGLTACDTHFETQPLPSRLARRIHLAPPLVRKLMTAGTLALECGAPPLMFAPRRARHASFAASTALQGLISSTGNFGFFNLLTAVLGLWLLDDEALNRVLPRRVAGFEEEAPPSRLRRDLGRARRLGQLAVVLPLLALSVLEITGRVWRRGRLPAPLRWLDEKTVTFRLINSYGLFSVMTTSRPEIQLEGSDDGRSWREYRFKFKPGDPKGPPRWVAPHQPRLDWQLWFAAMGGAPQWFETLMARLLEGSPEVLALLAQNPFPKAPPRYVRAVLYDYRFERDGRGGAYWKRRLVGPYFPTARLAATDESGRRTAV
ncbi:MAG: lipase maturation factor family protein [Oligoflexia bacterium]|nr:lipase maturation factor family protein [Oligoflexia bacterium]